jgi:hypothetical protein
MAAVEPPEGFSLVSGPVDKNPAASPPPAGFEVLGAQPKPSKKETVFREIPVPQGANITESQEVASALRTGDLMSAAMQSLDRELIEPAGENIRDAYARAKDVFTGEKRMTPEMQELERFSQLDFGELKEAFGVGNIGALKKNFQIAGMMLMTPGDEERKDILKSIDSRIEFEEDEKGNPIVVFPSGMKRALNKPGFDANDAMMLAGETAKYTPAARLAGMATTTLGRAGVGALAAFTTATAEESAQALSGGQYDAAAPFLAGLFGAGAEVMGPVAKRIWSRFSPEQRAKITAAKTMDDLLDAGVSRDDLKALGQEVRQAVQQAEESGLKAPLGAQVLAREEGAGVMQPLARMGVAAEQSERFAKEVARERIAQEQPAKQALKGIFGDADDDAMLSALEGVSETAEKVLGEAKLWRSKIAEFEYDKAFEGVPDIDTSGIRSRIEDLFDNVPQGSRLEGFLGNIKRQLTPRSPEAPILTATGKEIVPSALPPRSLQQINWELRDLRQIQNDKSITSAVKNRARIIENEITDMLEKATGYKYGKADETFRKMSDAIRKLTKGKIGKAAAKEEDQLSQITTAVFSPKPEQKALAKDFIKRLNEVDPKAADALYTQHFAGKMGALPEDATASQVSKAIFGDPKSEVSLVVDFARNPAERKRLVAVKQALKDAEKLENLSTQMGAARAEAILAEGKGPRALLGRIVYPRQAFKQAQLGSVQKDKAKAFFEAAISDDYADQFDKILSMKARPKEVMAEAESLIERVLLGMRRRGDIEPISKAGAVGALPEGSKASIEAEKLTPNETDSE